MWSPRDAKLIEKNQPQYTMLLCLALNTVQRRLDTRVLTPKEATEKARVTIGAEEEFFNIAMSSTHLR